MENEKRIQALQKFGYNEREAAFLVLAALHSGYFLGRQYADFLGQQRGRPDHFLCRKVLARKHGSVAVSLDQTFVYHLSSRLLFSAIGEPDNRNRRPCSTRTIKRRLMQLDYVLANRDVLYLPTERAKLDFFVEETGIDLAVLPVKRYRSKDGASFTLRYFVDKFPIQVSERVDGGALAVTFCFIDAGEATVSAFKSYLEQYRRLLSSLAQVRVVYVSDSRRHFEEARQAFERFRKSSPLNASAISTDSANDLLAYFELESSYQCGEYDRFDRNTLMRLRSFRDRFQNSESKKLYTLFQERGEAAVREQLSGVPGNLDAGSTMTFSTYLLDHRYRFLGEL